MNDTGFKAGALVIIFLMAIIAVYPILALERPNVEPFSELGLLGPNMKLGDYPSELTTGQSFDLYLYVGNHEGGIEYYRVLAKLGNVSSPIIEGSPIDAPVLASWDVILPNGGNSTFPIELAISKSGLYQRLVFELYNYEPDSDSLVYSP